MSSGIWDRVVRLSVLLAVGWLAGSAPVLAQAPDAATAARLAPLRLIQNMGVLVEDLTPDAEALAVTREAIQADAELRLRQAGLRINPVSAIPPMLYVQVSVVCGGGGSCAIDVSSAVIQEVWLDPGAERPYMAKTWHTGEVVLAPRALVDARVRAMVRAQTAAVADDVLASRAQ